MFTWIKTGMFKILPLVIFLSAWQLYCSTNARNIFLFASPSLVLSALIDNILNGVLIRDFAVTGLETVLGFAIGNIVGCCIGLSLWLSRSVAEISRPYVIAFGAIPIFAIAPMMIIWFGTGLLAKVIMAALSTVLVAITQSFEGARSVDKAQIDLLRAFGANKNQIFLKIIIPSSLLWVFNSLKLNVSFALLGAFIGEFISADSGLGFRILKAGGIYNVPLVLASITLLILLALILSGFIRFVESKRLMWKAK